MSKLRRIFMTIKRGITDQTAVCVFPWEKPLIEEIHGGNAIEVSIDDMCSKEGVKVVKTIKLKERVDLNGEAMVPEQGLDLRARLTRMTMVDPEEDPSQDPDSEYGRMQEKYGMHPELPILVVEKVYGSARQFRVCVRDFAAGRVPDFLDDGAVDDRSEDELAPAEMTMQQLRKALKARDIPYARTDTRDKLEELLVATA